MKKLCVWAVAALLMAACTPKAEKATDSGLLQSKFQTEVDGKKTDLFTLRNKNNMEVCVTNFGGRIVSVMVPDKDGQMRDVVLGFDSIQDYVSLLILVPASVVTQTVSIKVDSHWTALNISCLRIITVTACMAVRKDSSTVCLMPFSRIRKNWN